METNRAFKFGVYPYLSFEELQKRFTPFVKYLSEEIGHEITLHIGIDYPEHINTVGLDSVDIAYMGPAEYVFITRDYGQKPLLAIVETDHTIYYQGKIITRIDNQLNQLSDFLGSEFAFVQPQSTMGYLIPQWMLLQEESTLSPLSKPTFIGSHNNVAIGVLTGDYQIGAVKEEVFYTYEEQGLKCIATTPNIPGHCFVGQSKLSPELINKLQHALFNISATSSGKQILCNINQDITGILPIKDEEYNGLRKMLGQLKDSGLVK